MVTKFNFRTKSLQFGINYASFFISHKNKTKFSNIYASKMFGYESPRFCETCIFCRSQKYALGNQCAIFLSRFFSFFPLSPVAQKSMELKHVGHVTCWKVLLILRRKRCDSKIICIYWNSISFTLYAFTFLSRSSLSRLLINYYWHKMCSRN